MPYIIQDARQIFDDDIDKLTSNFRCRLPGDLNYIITRIIHEYLGLEKEARYSDYNEVIGVLECAKLELYRRHIAPYEDKAIEKNGDV